MSDDPILIWVAHWRNQAERHVGWLVNPKQAFYSSPAVKPVPTQISDCLAQTSWSILIRGIRHILMTDIELNPGQSWDRSGFNKIIICSPGSPHSSHKDLWCTLGAYTVELSASSSRTSNDCDEANMLMGSMLYTVIKGQRYCFLSISLLF